MEAMSLSFKVARPVIGLAKERKSGAKTAANPESIDPVHDERVADGSGALETDASAPSIEEIEAAIEARAAELAESLVRDQIKTLGETMQNAIAQLEKANARWQAELELGAVRLSLAIARKIIQKEVGTAPDVILYVVRETLKRAGSISQATLVCHPRDIALLEAADVAWKLPQTTEASIGFRADPDIAPGGCVLETENGQIDARIETQLLAVEKLLFGTDAKRPGSGLERNYDQAVQDAKDLV